MGDTVPLTRLDGRPPGMAAGWRFDGFEFDERRAELNRPNGSPIALRPKAEALLRHFLSRPGVLCTRDELVAAVWPSTVVGDDSLVQCVGELRAAFGDRGPALIRTVPRRGYRFEATVVRLGGAASTAGPSTADAAPEGPAPLPTRGRSSRRLAAAAAVVAIALGLGFLWTTARSPPQLSLDELMTARHVIAVLPLTTTPDDDPRLREIAGRVGEEIAAQVATRPGTRSIGPAGTAEFDAASPRLQLLAKSLHATYAVTGRVRAASGPHGASIDVQVLALPEGVSLGSAQIEVETSPAAPTAAETGQLVANLVRGKGGERELKLATAPGHVPDAAETALIGWEEVNRMATPADVLRARSRFREALRQDPDSMIGLTGLVATYVMGRSLHLPLTADEHAESERAIDRMLKFAPNDATGALLWAELQLQDGRPDLAIPAIERSNRQAPQFPNGHLMLAVALIRVGRLDEAATELDRAIRLAILSSEQRRASSAYIASAEIALMRGDDARAGDMARRAIALRPASLGVAPAYAVLAAAEALSGQSAEAAADMAIYRQRVPGATVASYDAQRPSTHPAFLSRRARLYEGLRQAGLPER